MGYTAESIIAGGEQSYTGRGFNASLQGFYCRQIVINEDVTASGFLAQDINGDDITSEVVDTSSITRLKIGQLLTFRTPVYRVTASDGSMTFYGEGQTRELPDPYLGTTLAPYSLAFDARAAEQLSDCEANTLYFRDSNFNRVGATFSRSTTATRVNKQGLIENVAANVPRIDYTDGSAKLLMEPSRTNYFLNNGDADNGSWTKFNVVKNGDYNDGKITGVIGRRYEPSGAGVAAAINRTGTGLGLAGEITFSYIVKYAGWRWVELTTTQDSDISRVWFDLENGVKGTDADNVGRIVDLGDQTYLLSYTTSGRTTGSNGTCFFSFRSADNSTAAVNADGTGVVFYVCQYEEGSYPTSYIPTAGSAVTRNADAVSQSGLSSYINSLNGVINMKASVFDKNVFQWITLNDGTNNNLFGIRFVGAERFSMRMNVNNSFVVNNATAADYTSNITYTAAYRYEAFNHGLFVNGSKLLSNLTEDVPFSNNQINTLSLGYGSGISNTPYGTISQILIFPTALTDSECEQLTS